MSLLLSFAVISPDYRGQLFLRANYSRYLCHYLIWIIAKRPARRIPEERDGATSSAAPSQPRRAIRLYYGAPGSLPRGPAIHNYIHEAGHVSVIEGTHFYSVPGPLRRPAAPRPGSITTRRLCRAAQLRAARASVPPALVGPRRSRPPAASLSRSSSSLSSPAAHTPLPGPPPPRTPRCVVSAVSLVINAGNVAPSVGGRGFPGRRAAQQGGAAA